MRREGLQWAGMCGRMNAMHKGAKKEEVQMNDKKAAILASGLALVPVVLPWLVGYSYPLLEGIMSLVGSLCLAALPWMILRRSKIGSIACAIGLALGGLNLAIIAFVVVTIVALNRTLKKWVLYLPPACCLALNVVSFLQTVQWWGFVSPMMVVCNVVSAFAFPATLFLVAYVISLHGPIETQDAQGTRRFGFSLGADKTGFSYLDEYKKNMRK